MQLEHPLADLSAGKKADHFTVAVSGSERCQEVVASFFFRKEHISLS
jgi:hypothetical protein